MERSDDQQARWWTRLTRGLIVSALLAPVAFKLVPTLESSLGGRDAPSSSTDAQIRTIGVVGYRVTNTGGTGVRFRMRARINDIKQPVHLVPDGSPFEILCQTWGEPVGPRSNHIWDLISHRNEIGYIPDLYTNTPAPANRYTGGIPRCLPGNSFVQNGQIMGVGVNDVHSWGPCRVQDFSRGISGLPWGWFLRAGSAGPDYTVRSGMMWGYFDNGGAAGRLGCPTSNEYAYRNGARQNFQRGQLEWHPGMNHARLVAVSPAASPPPAPSAADRAIAWGIAQGQEHATTWDHWCLTFVRDAYFRGAELEIGGAYSAYDWWTAHSDRQVRGDLNAPRGALVFWNYFTIDQGQYRNLGHVGLSLGDGTMLTSLDLPGTRGVHIARIDSQGKGFLGYIRI